MLEGGVGVERGFLVWDGSLGWMLWWRTESCVPAWAEVLCLDGTFFVFIAARTGW